jgi:hypothetical protein
LFWKRLGSDLRMEIGCRQNYDLVKESQRVGLRDNIAKTKDLRVNRRTTKAFKTGEFYSYSFHVDHV